MAGLAIGGAVILSEIIDGPDDPAGKAASDAQKAEEECEEDCCKKIKEQCIQGCSDFVLQKPRSRRKDLGGMDFHRCVRQCMDRNGC